MRDFLSKLKNNNLAKSSTYVLLMRVVGTALSYLFLWFLALRLGDEGVGLYELLNKLVMLLGTIAILGGNMIILQYSGKLRSSNQIHLLSKVLAKNYWIWLITSIVLGCILFFFAPFIATDLFKKPHLESYIKYLWIIFPFFGIIQVNLDYLRAKKRLKISEFLRNIPKPVLAIAFIWFFTKRFSNKEDALFLVLLFLFLTWFILSISPLLKDFFSFSKEKVKVSFSNIVGDGFSLMFASISLLILSVIDVLMLTALSDTLAPVGLYSVALKIVLPIGFILSSVNQVTAPEFSEFFFSKKYKELQAIITRSTKLIFGTSLPIMIGILLLSGVLLGVFGREFLEAKTALYILLAGQFINVVCGPTGNYLTMTGNQAVFRNILLIAIVINVMLNLWLIPQYGINGAALSTSISLAFWNIVGAIVIYFKYKLKVFYYPKF